MGRLNITKVDQSRSKFILNREKKMSEDKVEYKISPKTLKQRQDTLRAKRKANGYVEITAWVEVGTRDQLKAQASDQRITIGQQIDQLIKG